MQEELTPFMDLQQQVGAEPEMEAHRPPARIWAH